MPPIPPDVPTLIEMITRYMRDHYQPQDPSKMKEEADDKVECLRTRAAGRVLTQGMDVVINDDLILRNKLG